VDDDIRDISKGPTKKHRCQWGCECINPCVKLLKLLNQVVLLLSRVVVVLLRWYWSYEGSTTWDAPTNEIPSPSLLCPNPCVGIWFAACLSLLKLPVMVSLLSLRMSTISTRYKKNQWKTHSSIPINTWSTKYTILIHCVISTFKQPHWT